MLFALAAGLAVLQHAPSDVPRGHWAFKAVDDLFAAGILHGYPESTQPLILANAHEDKPWLDARIRQWKSAGLLVGYPDGLCGVRPDSRYEEAVAVHAVWASLVGLLRNAEPSGADRADLVAQIPDLTKAISMRRTELDKLGGEPVVMVRELHRLGDPAGKETAYHGGR